MSDSLRNGLVGTSEAATECFLVLLLVIIVISFLIFIRIQLDTSALLERLDRCGQRRLAHLL
jgi:hypothetical protein